MKQSFSFWIIATLLFACSKKDAEPAPMPTSYTLETNPSLDTQYFKTDYTIQFPAGFEGGRYRIFGTEEGYGFKKYNTTDTLFYNYENEAYQALDFGANLANTSARQFLCDTFTSLMVTHGLTPKIFLPNRIDFTNADTTVGIFYYDNKDISTGNLFWKYDPEYAIPFGCYEFVYARFKKENLSQIIEIIRTIQKR